MWLLRRRRVAGRAGRARGGLTWAARTVTSWCTSEGPLHRVAPQCKLLATVLFVFAVVATPKEQFWAFGVFAGMVVLAAARSGGSRCSASPGGSSSRCRSCCSPSCCRCSGGTAASRSLGLHLSAPGLWAAWNILAKGTIGVAASIVLASTTSVPHLLAGLERLHVPAPARRHHRVHGPLRRRDRRRAAPDAHRPRVARRIAAARSATPRRWRRRPARCSCGRTSGASGCTWRWRRAATPARCRCAAGGPRGGSWVACLAVAGRGGGRRGGRVAGAVVTRARGPRPRLPLPGRHRRPRRRRPHASSAASGSRCWVPTAPARRRWCWPSTASTPPAGAASPSAGWPVEKANLAEIRRRVGIVFQDPDDQLFMPTVRDDVAFGPSNLGLRGDELAARTRRGVGTRSAWPTPPSGRRTTSASASAGASPWPPSWRCDPTCSSSTSRRRTSTRSPAGSWPRSCSASTSPRSWSPTTCPYALQLCGRAVILDGGRIVADGPTGDVLADRDVMAAHRLELPFGFDPRVECRPARRSVTAWLSTCRRWMTSGSRSST